MFRLGPLAGGSERMAIPDEKSSITRRRNTFNRLLLKPVLSSGLLIRRLLKSLASALQRFTRYAVEGSSVSHQRNRIRRPEMKTDYKNKSLTVQWLIRWHNGINQHNPVTGQCVPDFRCCHKHLPRLNWGARVHVLLVAISERNHVCQEIFAQGKVPYAK